MVPHFPASRRASRRSSLSVFYHFLGGKTHVFFFFFFFDFFNITFIEPHCTSHGELNQPSPQFQADRPQSVKVYGHIEGHSNLNANANFIKGYSIGGLHRC